MNAFLRLILPTIRITPPSWKIKRWFRRVGQTLLELLAIVGIAALIAVVWYLAMFVF